MEQNTGRLIFVKRKNIIFDLNGVLFEKSFHEPGTMVPIDQGVQLLRECSDHKAGHQLFVCSNMKAQHLDQINKQHADIMGIFHGIITPENAPAEKPDPEIFTYLLKKYRLLPEDSILIDDHLINITVVNSLGLTGIHMVTFDQARDELQRLGVL